MDKATDILIIGGGLIGASLLYGLRQSGYRCLLVESRPLKASQIEHRDARSLALSRASQTIFQNLGLWPKLAEKAAAIERIHISEQGRFGNTLLKAKAGQALGQVIEMPHIEACLYPKLDPATVLAPAKLTGWDPAQNLAQIEMQGQSLSIQAQLIIAADGADSKLRQLAGLKAERKDYSEQALVATLELDREHRHQAFERFCRLGPMALLPLQKQRLALVWSLPRAKATAFSQMAEPEFLSLIQQEFGYRLGRFKAVGRRSCYPLAQVIMPMPIAWPLAFIGNAAHSIHPIAAQGFNLGLRDVAMLLESITALGLGPNMLEFYQQQRHSDQKTIIQLTDGLLNSFASKIPGLSVARGLSLLGIDNCHWIKGAIARVAGGYAGIIPDLACGLASDHY